MLWHQVELDLTGAEAPVAVALRYLTTSADHHVEPLATMHYSVVSRAGGHQVTEEGDHLDTVAGPEQVLDLVYRRVHQRAFELASLRGWVRLHAAVVDVGPATRVLLVAPSGTGKTTLACRLLLDGQAVAADESTLVREGRSLPVARRFHLKPGVEEVVAGLDRFTDDLPALSDGSVRAFDPAQAGFAWDIVERSVAHVVLVERATGPARLDPASAVATMPELVEQSFPHQEATGELLAQVASLLRSARCWRLGVDSAADASILVRGLAAD